MPRVSANGDDLRRFAGQLRTFSKDIEGNLNRLQGQFRSLDWDDEEQRKFEREFQKSVQSVRTFLKSIDHYSPTLERKARALDDFAR
jgi:hypothetical protein